MGAGVREGRMEPGNVGKVGRRSVKMTFGKEMMRPSVVERVGSALAGEGTLALRMCTGTKSRSRRKRKKNWR